MIKELMHSLRPILRPVLRRASDAVYPPYVCCPLCGREKFLPEEGICEECRASLRYAPELEPLPPLSGLYSLWQYSGAGREAVLRLKYSNATYLADVFAEQMRIPQDWLFDYIIPVPLHRSRLRKRGYNQSEMLANAISNLHGGRPVYAGYLKRNKRTRPQQGLSESQRRRNLQGVFTASLKVKGAHILLIDDVVTTGTTLQCCAEELIRKGAVAVYAVTVCCVPKDRQGA